MSDERVELDVLDPENTEKICVDKCGGKCCNFKENDYSVNLSIDDYRRLYDHNLHHFVTFLYNDIPKLVNQKNGYCIFFDNESKKCSIHPIRPKVCRLFPFSNEEENVDEKCILYYETDPDIREKLYEEQHDKKYIKTGSQIENDKATKLYGTYQRDGDTFIQNKITNYFTLDGANQYWLIFLTEQGTVSDAKTMIKELQKEYSSQDWKTYSIRAHNEETDLLFQLVGIVRNSVSVSIPHIERFPPERENFMRLINKVENDPGEKDHFLGAVTVPDSFRTKLREEFHD